MKNYHKIIDSLLQKSAEEECYELKENWYEPHAIGEYISALSNAAALQHKENAYMLWGIREEDNKVVGTTFDFRKSTKQEPLEHYLARQLNPDTNFSFHEITYQQKRLVLLEIPKAKQIPLSFDGVRYLRIGSSKVKLSHYPEREVSLFKVLQGKEKGIEEIASEHQNLKFSSLFTYYAGRGIALNLATFEKNLGLRTKDGEYNLLAQLLSDNNRIPLRVSIFLGENKASKLYSVREFGNSCLLVSLVKVLEYLDVLNILQADEENREVERIEVSLFDMEATREAIINAFVHNKWVEGNAPMITVYSNRLEILSRGTLAPNQTMEGFFLGESIPVNQKLSDIFLQLHISERSGRGVPKIIEKYGKQAFQFRENSIVVSIPFHWINKKQAPSQMKEDTLNENQKKLLLEIRNNPNITVRELEELLPISKTTISTYLKYLQNNGYIQRIGSNRNGYWDIL